MPAVDSPTATVEQVDQAATMAAKVDILQMHQQARVEKGLAVDVVEQEAPLQ
jgi:hypothetical protein